MKCAASQLLRYYDCGGTHEKYSQGSDIAFVIFGITKAQLPVC